MKEKLRNHYNGAADLNLMTSSQPLNSEFLLSTTIQLFFLTSPPLPCETGCLLSRAVWHRGMACIVRGDTVLSSGFLKGFVLSSCWRNKFQNALQADAQSLIKVFVMCRERDAVSEIRGVGLCNFVLWSVVKSQ